ncbi:MAG: ribosome maturation factor RimM [Clostridia bacterium]
MSSILIGQIVNVHGIKGEVKIYPYTDDIDNLIALKKIFFDSELEEEIKINSCKIHKGMLVVKLSGIDTIKKAEALKNKYIYIPKISSDKLEEDTFYVEDLIGIEVLDMQENHIGKITYVMPTGANDVYEVDSTKFGKIYLPAIKQVVKKVDIKANKMYVEIMDGLI